MEGLCGAVEYKGGWVGVCVVVDDNGIPKPGTWWVSDAYGNYDDAYNAALKEAESLMSQQRK